MILENYNGSHFIDRTILSRNVSTKHRDIDGGNLRDVLKSFSKRIYCQCLKEKYSVARTTLPKRGFCNYCKQVRVRAMLSVCSRCRVFQYCSRECQVAHWPEHEICCCICVKVHKQEVITDNSQQGQQGK